MKIQFDSNLEYQDRAINSIVEMEKNVVQILKQFGIYEIVSI